ncbi:unnamed protein product, partial [marine sediment metagenome]
SPLRIAIGLPFVLFFPGYTLICALFPGKKDLDGIERLALSIGLSLAVVPLIGLALNYTPFGIRLHPIVVSLFLFTLLMSILSTYRRDELPSDSRFVPSISVKIPEWRALSRSDKLISFGLVSCIVVATGFTIYVLSMPKVKENFTEFYVLESGEKIENYPTNLTLGESKTVILGVVNHEYAKIDYRIIIKLDNETIGTIDNITLNHEINWEKKYTFTPDKTGEKMKLLFLLFREELDVPQYSLHLWIRVQPPQ